MGFTLRWQALRARAPIQVLTYVNTSNLEHESTVESSPKNSWRSVVKVQVLSLAAIQPGLRW